MTWKSIIFAIAIFLFLGYTTQGHLLEQRIEACIHFVDIKKQEEISLIEIRKGRFTDGIEIVKTLYEKLLDLDHHYASQSISQDIETISNPLSYAEFNNSMDKIKNSVKSKKSIELPQSLDNNPFVSLGFTLVSSLFGNDNKKERETNLNKVSCILDMTIQLHSDLKLIYHETEIMKNSSESILKECEKLFSNVVNTVDFRREIKECRQNDGWEDLQNKVDAYFELRLDEIQKTQFSRSAESLSDDIDIDFSINRITYFLERYEEFISQSEQQYEKFANIINRYEAHSNCTESLPKEYTQLKIDINAVTAKFKNAYKLSELNGSKLKNMLYGEK